MNRIASIHRMDLRSFVEKYGQTGAAKKLGVTQGAVWQWLNGQRITAERAVDIEAKSGGEITRHELLPDIFGPIPTPAPAAAPQEAA